MIDEEIKEQIRLGVQIMIETYKIIVEELEKTDLPEKVKDFIMKNFKVGE